MGAQLCMGREMSTENGEGGLGGSLADGRLQR